MPVYRSRDSQGPFYQWGKGMGKKYYYIPNNKQSREIARKKSIKQGLAIKISQGR